MNTNRHLAKRWVLVPDAVGRNAGARVPLDDEKLKHLRKVLRMEWGESVQLLDGSGRVFSASLLQRGPLGEFELLELLENATESEYVELVIGLAKNTTMDWVIEKAVECGARKITPIVFSRSVVKPHADELGKYSRRWQAIADAAVEQSEQRFRTEVSNPIAFETWVAHEKQRACIKVLFVSETRQDSSDHELVDGTFTTFREALSKGPSGAAVVIGPEGGFTDSERQQMLGAGYVEASLGRSVLRVETAVIAALMWLKLVRHVVR